MMISKTYTPNPLLELTLETSSDETLRFFETRYAGLHASGDQVVNSKAVVCLKEVPDLRINAPRIMREITIPELCLFDEQNFVIVKDKKRIKIPFLEIGQAPELSVFFEAGFPTYWLWRFLDDVISYHLIGMGASLYHAASVVRKDCEIIIPGWGGTGKTTALLWFLEDGSSTYQAEDHLVIKGTGESYIYTDAGYIAFEERDRFPAVRSRYRAIGFPLGAAIAKIVLPFIPPRGEMLEFVRRVLTDILTPKILIKLTDCLPDLQISNQQPARRIVLQLIAQRDLDRPISKPIDVDSMVDRTLSGMQYEREDFRMMYYAFVYATGRRNQLIDNAVERELEILQKALESAACYEVRITENWPENFAHITHLLQSSYL